MVAVAVGAIIATRTGEGIRTTGTHGTRETHETQGTTMTEAGTGMGMAGTPGEIGTIGEGMTGGTIEIGIGTETITIASTETTETEILIGVDRVVLKTEWTPGVRKMVIGFIKDKTQVKELWNERSLHHLYPRNLKLLQNLNLFTRKNRAA